MDIKDFLLALSSSDIAKFINTARGAFAVVETFHVIAITMVFGTIFIVDLRLIGLSSTRRAFTQIAAETLRWTWGAFAVAALTGSLLFITNPVFYFENFEFRAKMVLLLLAAVNMAVFEFQTVKSVVAWDTNSAVPMAARVAGALSLVLWIGVVTFGRLIGFAASAMADPFAALG